jgi:hypothetical protein
MERGPRSIVLSKCKNEYWNESQIRKSSQKSESQIQVNQVTSQLSESCKIEEDSLTVAKDGYVGKTKISNYEVRPRSSCQPSVSSSR